MFDQGDSYSSVNAARNALSTFIPSTNKATIGSSREVCRLVKGVFEARPALPKHTNTWSVDSVLDCMCSLPEIAELTLKQLTLRTVMLLAQDKGVTPCICSKSEIPVCTTTNVLLCSPVNTDIRMHHNKCVIVFSSKHKQNPVLTQNQRKFQRSPQTPK